MRTTRFSAQARFISRTGKKLWRLSRSGRRKEIFNLAVETIARAARGELIFGNPSRRAWAPNPAPTRRESHRVKVAAITGSNGKTTTKEITAGILGRRFRILNNEGNLNNLIGLPLSLLKLWKVHEIAVREMGMNAPGEIRRLKAIADPQVSLITNVGRAHLEFLGILEGVARAKGELWEELRKEDWIAVNADDERVTSLAATARFLKKSFGIEKPPQEEVTERHA